MKKFLLSASIESQRFYNWVKKNPKRSSKIFGTLLGLIFLFIAVPYIIFGAKMAFYGVLEKYQHSRTISLMEKEADLDAQRLAMNKRVRESAEKEEEYKCKRGDLEFCKTKMVETPQKVSLTSQGRVILTPAQLDKLAVGVSKAETGGCTTGTALTHKNCFGIKNGGQFVHHNSFSESFVAFKSVWTRLYGGLPTLAMAIRYTGGDNSLAWLNTVISHYKS